MEKTRVSRVYGDWHPKASLPGGKYVCLLCTCVLANEIKRLVSHGWEKAICVTCVHLGLRG